MVMVTALVTFAVVMHASVRAVVVSAKGWRGRVGGQHERMMVE